MMQSSQSQVRLADLDDVVGISMLGHDFARHYPLDVEWELGGLITQIQGLIASPDTVIFVAVDDDGEPFGVLVGMETGVWFAPSTRIATELAWWVDPECRGGTAALRLVRMFQDWAASRGIKHVALSSIVTDGGPTAGRFIERQGFKLVERSYIKSEV